ncbi:O-antigen ligase family protein [Candidatus Amesbacteria bacterium]|nr:O-antigen ligase family protein [Candidatus Amesbacteria bacterium]
MLAKFIAILLLVIPLYPKFPILGVSGTFVSVRLEDFLIAAIFLVFLLHKPSFSTPLHRSILLYLFLGLVSTFSAIVLTKSISLNLGLLHLIRRLEYMSLFFIGFSFLTSLSQISFLVRTILVTSLLVAIYGLGQQFLSFPVITTTNSEFSKGLTLTLGPEARINSTFAGHYDLAAYTVFPLLLILGLLSLPNIKFKPLLFAVGLLVYWTLLLSASRVTFAAFYLSAFAFVWLIAKKVWIPLLLILAFFSVLISPQLAGRYRQLIFPLAHAQVPADEQTADALVPVAEDRSFNIRLKAEWPRAVRAFLKNPVLGTGYSSVGLAVDNDYLRALAETGILGLLAFLLIIFRFLKTPPPFNNSLESIFILSVTLSLVSLLLNALFIDVFEASKIALTTWLLLGLAEKTKILQNKA